MQASASTWLRVPQQGAVRSQLVPHARIVTLAGSGAAAWPAAGPPDAQCSVDGWRRPLSDSACATLGTPSSPTTGSGAAALPPVVALGKFDALHKGHQALAIAAAHLGGSPWLVSFSGIAEVLGWPARLPLVAPCDRRRVLEGWSGACGGRTPRECAIPFAEVRTMSPEAFVAMLAEDLRVAGVVVGANYRFGYRAAGTAELLQQLGPQHGMQVRVLDLVGSEGAATSQHHHNEQQQQQQQHPHDHAVSSSRVRRGLAAGDFAQVEECLGRPYRLVVSLAGACSTEGRQGAGIRLGLDSYHNQPPGSGDYLVAAAWCPAGGSTLECEKEGWRDAHLEIDETGLTVSGTAAGAAGWLERGGGLLALDFRSSRLAGGSGECV